MSTWTRVGAAAGVTAAVLYVIGAFAAGNPPAPDASTDSVIGHLQDHRDALLVGMVLTGIALVLFVWFLGYLRALLAEAEASIGEPGAPLATVTLVSFLLLFAVIAAGSIAYDVVVWRGAGAIDPNLVRLAVDGQTLATYALTSTVALLSVLAPTIVIARTRVLPQWLVVLGGLEIAANLVELLGWFSRSGWNTGGYAGGVGPVLWVVWVGAVSITMLVRRVPAEQVAAEPAVAP